MDNNEVQLVGGPCGQHGPYTFYKAFKYTKNGIKRIMTLSEFFFVKLWIDSDLVCIGELQLLWIDKNSDQVLASLRLYFLPENTPEGRMDHGEDEVLAISEKVVLRVEDLITWITSDAEWTWGRLAKCESDVKEPKPEEKDTSTCPPFKECSLDFADVEKERKTLDEKIERGPTVIILSYPRYCRYRAMMKRLEGVEQEFLKYKLVTALGGFTVTSKNTRVLFCRDTFDYPDLEGHELLCNHLAPKLKGRPRGKRKKRSLSPGSESNESESSGSNVPSSNKPKITTEGGRNGLRCDTITSPRRSTRSTENSESKVFLKKLYSFMKTNRTPIGRIPQCGYKELDLYAFYTKVQKIGGYDAVVTNRLWKSIFDDLSGNHNSTSAATVIRRHYERFLLPYERHVKGEEYKPMSVSERRRLKSKTNSTSDAETSEGTASESGKTTPVPNSNSGSATPSTPTTPVENKEFNIQIKTEGKISSLRSVRVKPERLRENGSKDSKAPDNLPSTEIEVKIKKEPDVDSVQDTKQTNMNTSSNNLVEKSSEPVTTAVAPVAQKTTAEISLSPAEGKEDVAVMNTEEAANASSENISDLNNMPCKSKTPDSSTNLERNINKDQENVDSTLMREVKKRKLDILKEGGLEVTPVTSFVAPSSVKDIRPSVIHQATPMNISADKQYMPPPMNSAIPTKRVTPQNNIPQIPLVPSLQTLPKTSAKPKAPFNGQSPPKVVQSRSIYSYSEKMVYGNPKECVDSVFPKQNIESPRFAGMRQTGGDILDLRVTSPQKPVVEIMRVPAVSSASHMSFNYRDSMKSMYKKKLQPLPIIDGKKIGSNLEITLVGSPNNKSPYSVHNQLNKFSMNPTSSGGYKKRTYGESYLNSKYSRIEENGRLPRMNSTSSHAPSKEMKNSGLEISIPSPFAKSHTVSNHMKLPNMVTSDSKPPIVPQMFNSHFPLLPNAGKNLPPFMPMVDPLYYTTFQSMYPTNNVPPSIPILPVPTAEQLRLYSELMARARIPFPFSDNGPSTASENNTMKKL